MLHSTDLPTRLRHARTHARGGVDAPRRHRLTASSPWPHVSPRAPRALPGAWADLGGDLAATTWPLVGHNCGARVARAYQRLLAAML